MTGHDTKNETSVASESEPEFMSLPVRGDDDTAGRYRARVRAAPGENEMNSDKQSNLDASGLLTEPKDGAAVSLSLGKHPTNEEQEVATPAGVDDTTRIEHVKIPQPATAPPTPCSQGEWLLQRLNNSRVVDRLVERSVTTTFSFLFFVRG